MKKLLSSTMIFAVIAALAVHAFAADVPQDGLIGHFRLDGDLVNDVTGLSATRLYRNFRPLDEESERTAPPTFYDGLDGMCYTIFNDGDSEVHYAIDTGVSPGNGDFTFGMWLLDERVGGTNLEYMRYGDSVYRNNSDEPYKFFSIETGSAYSASGGNWLSMGPMISYTVGENSEEYEYKLFLNEKNNFKLITDEYISPYYGGVNWGVQTFMPWIHVAVSCSLDSGGDTYTVTLYQNGKAVNVCKGVPNPYRDGGENNIYCIVQNADISIYAYIDDIVIYDRALDADEIAELYGSYDLTEVRYAPQTGDEAPMLIAAAVVSGAAIVVMKKKRGA